MPKEKMLMAKAIDLKLFDPSWYKYRYALTFDSDEAAFSDYLRKSTFADICPSLAFDNSAYLRCNPDVYISGISPLQHYLEIGKSEERTVTEYDTKWLPSMPFVASNYPHKRDGKYAIVLHIFYVEFIAKFYDAIYGVDFNFDLYITSTDQSIIDQCTKKFATHPQLLNFKAALVPNKGRNFGPFLVEFGADLKKYDFFLHMHSKKSLYSGREQSQWSNYLAEYLVRDKHILAQGLNILENNNDFGLYYPTSFWNLPPWVNHWLKNKGLGKHILSTVFNIDHHEEFFAYPVGGMFWARTAALSDLLDKKWTYDDFPSEPLPSDGSLLHVLERILPILANNRGYDQFFYDPSSATFGNDCSYVFKDYMNHNEYSLRQSLTNKDLISFDIFDTIVKRDYLEPDLAKYLLPERAGLKIPPIDFVKLRNNAERAIREKRSFQGDVDIYEIYEILAQQLETTLTAEELAQLEFDIDLEMLAGKPIMIELVNALALTGKQIIFISDTYYSESQIQKLLRHAGINCKYELYISSKLKLRKDNATMWAMINEKLISSNKKDSFIHIGDNVCSDAQNPGDLGLTTFHILNPMDKWDALGFPSIRKDFSIDNPMMVAKWGQVVGEVGSNPFI